MKIISKILIILILSVPLLFFSSGVNLFITVCNCFQKKNISVLRPDDCCSEIHEHKSCCSNSHNENSNDNNDNGSHLKQCRYCYTIHKFLAVIEPASPASAKTICLTPFIALDIFDETHPQITNTLQKQLCSYKNIPPGYHTGKLLLFFLHQLKLSPPMI